ncbi:MAG TPA: MATE family efflux transporter, partial [Sedimentisphaerales bacterium]|nr:MATE family efflux transporter [Sedimentisphaerales bacterium]
MERKLLGYWDGAGGAREVLKLAFPLMLSTSIATVQMFTDRVFLMWYDTDAMSGAMQGGITAFAAIALFLGITMYVSTFVAQYAGADKPHRVGPSVWQGIYFACISGGIMLALSWAGESIFAFIGHAPEIRAYEITYFRIMCIGATPVLLGASLSCFFSGRGRTWPIFWVDLASCTVNVVLNYVMIFGRFGFPAWGLAGAAWATVIANVVRAVIYFAMFIGEGNEKLYRVRSGWRPEANLCRRMIRYGLPSGVQFCLDVMAFAFFLAVIGRMGSVEFAATTVVFQINHLAFMPMVGVGMAVGILVGQRLGEDKPDLAARTTWISALISLGYMTAVAVAFVAVPDIFLRPFARYADAMEFGLLRDISVRLLWFVAFYSLFDTGNIIFASTLNGAGDTRFVMVMSVGLSWLVMVLPVWIVADRGLGLYWAWVFATAYVCVLAVVLMVRVLQGRWMKMRVIERTGPAVPPVEIGTPTISADMP